MQGVNKRSALRRMNSSSSKHPAEYAIAPSPCKGWVCYLLRCADDTLYCGITNDLEKRLAAHNAGTASKYTRARLPIELAFAEPCANRSTASKRERAIKQMARGEKLKLCAREPIP